MENKKICILIIASIDKELYKHYILTHWKDLLNNNYSISIYFLLDNDKETIDFFKTHNLINYCIINAIDNCNSVSPYIHGTLLTKTISAFDKLVDKYDVYLRTNLSSFLKLDQLFEYVQNNNISYSGIWCWENALRSDLLFHDKVGINKSIKTLDELDKYPENTFFSGSCFFLNNNEVKYIVNNKDIIRYDIVDDVSFGLLFKNYTHIKANCIVVYNNSDIDESVKSIKSTDSFWNRFNHLNLDVAKLLYNKLTDKEL